GPFFASSRPRRDWHAGMHSNCRSKRLGAMNLRPIEVRTKAPRLGTHFALADPFSERILQPATSAQQRRTWVGAGYGVRPMAWATATLGQGQIGMVTLSRIDNGKPRSRLLLT